MLTGLSPPRPATAPSRDRLEAVLADLYRRQLALSPRDGYLRIHARPAGVRGHVRNFLWYGPYLPDGGAILDWGCNHAPDSCLLRARFGDRYQLHGCDFRPAGCFRAFHEYAGLTFAALSDVVRLPYPDAAFDAVIGSGTLEHTAMDYESLKELYRVLRPDGVLVVTYLPNRLSVQEWLRRTLRKPGAHHRLYGLAEASEWLKRSGFLPVAAEHQAFFWDAVREGLKLPPPLVRLLRRSLPVHLFSSTLRFVARKVTTM